MLTKRIVATAIGIPMSLTLFMGTATAADQTALYSFTTIDVPLVDASATTALAINPEGTIVGRYMIGIQVHGYLLSKSGLTLIDDPEILPTAPVTYAAGINAEGTVVGYYLDPPPGTDLSTLVQGQMGMDFDMSGDPPPSTRLRGFLRSQSGDYTPIDFPASKVPSSYPSDGYIQTMPEKVSSTGILVGCFHHLGNDYQITMHGFLYQDGQYQFFPLEGSMHNGLTPDGQIIVGVWYPDLTHYHSYVIIKGVYTKFDPPEAVISAAWDVNPRGEIVGNYTDSSGITHGYLLNAAGFTTLDFPNAMMTQLRGINSRGDIVGFYMDAEGAVHGLLATKTQ